MKTGRDIAKQANRMGLGNLLTSEVMTYAVIEAMAEVQDHATEWLWTYNNDRPNMGIGSITPAQKLKVAA